MVMISSSDLLALTVASAAVLAQLLSMSSPQVRHAGDWLCERSAGPLRHPVLPSKKVDGLTFGIDCPLQIFPLSPDSDVSLIHSPPVSHGRFMPSKCPIQQRYQPYNPAVKSEMVDGDTAFSHYLLQIRRLSE